MKPLNAPRISFAEVNDAARQIWAYLYNVPWPAGWYVRVGTCNERADGIAGFGVNGYGGEIELKWVPRVGENLLHELVHVKLFSPMHDLAFAAELAYVRGKCGLDPVEPVMAKWSRI